MMTQRETKEKAAHESVLEFRASIMHVEDPEDILLTEEEHKVFDKIEVCDSLNPTEEKHLLKCLSNNSEVLSPKTYHWLLKHIKFQRTRASLLIWIIIYFNIYKVPHRYTFCNVHVRAEGVDEARLKHLNEKAKNAFDLKEIPYSFHFEDEKETFVKFKPKTRVSVAMLHRNPEGKLVFDSKSIELSALHFDDYWSSSIRDFQKTISHTRVQMKSVTVDKGLMSQLSESQTRFLSGLGREGIESFLLAGIDRASVYQWFLAKYLFKEEMTDSRKIVFFSSYFPDHVHSSSVVSMMLDLKEKLQVKSIIDGLTS